MKLKCLVPLFALPLVLSVACIRPKTMMDVQVPFLADPGGAKVAAIGKVVDARKFMPDVNFAGQATVARNEELSDRSITVKTIGQAHGRSDIVLPEGRTVETLVADGVRKALREKGYSVAAAGAPAPADAPALDVEIRNYWLWFMPGFWVVTVYFDAELDLKGPMVVDGKAEAVKAHYEMSSPMAVPGMYTGTAEQGNVDLVARIKDKLLKP